MSRYIFKLPDLGEGTVEAEIVGWRVKPGDLVAEDDVIVEVMTEKAAVEVPAPVAGRVVSTTGAPGDMVPVGADLIVFETEPGTTNEAAPAAGAAAAAVSREVAAPSAAVSRESASRTNGAGNGHAHLARPGRVATSPAIRRRAREAGVDLTQLAGSGPNGRILRRDFEAFVSSRTGPKLVRSWPTESVLGSVPVGAGSVARAPEPGSSARAGELASEARAADVGLGARAADAGAEATQEIKVIGVRRLIAQRMSEAKRNIPHFAYVEEMDITELESLRCHLNSKLESGQPALTYLPFVVSALIRVLRDFPQCNALYDAERGVIVRHRAVHIGVATQTPEGLKVPVVRDAQSLSLWELAAQIRRVTEAARTNKATREELSGSTITVTSLGKLGGIASTPIINAPEVSIIGINRAVERPMVYEGAITIRRMMNLSSSFDHRFVDGHDAAAMIQSLRERIEHPATIFL